MLRFLLPMIAFVVVCLAGLALGINPSLAEMILVVVACAASDLVRDIL